MGSNILSGNSPQSTAAESDLTAALFDGNSTKGNMTETKIVRAHLCKKPIERLNSVTQTGKPDCKPKGFWYDVDGSWSEWCQSEMPHWIHDLKYEVDVSACNMLLLQDAISVLLFSRKFGVTDQFNHTSLDWKAVAKEFDGIEISPYQHSLRFNDDCSWYYPWDVASGCVWNVEKLVLKRI
jgi:hypothetical protein